MEVETVLPMVTCRPDVDGKASQVHVVNVAYLVCLVALKELLHDNNVTLLAIIMLSYLVPHRYVLFVYLYR